jgi:hypothetical protein
MVEAVGTSETVLRGAISQNHVIFHIYADGRIILK